jgi:hypothetical protein
LRKRPHRGRNHRLLASRSARSIPPRMLLFSQEKERLQRALAKNLSLVSAKRRAEANGLGFDYATGQTVQPNLPGSSAKRQKTNTSAVLPLAHASGPCLWLSLVNRPRALGGCSDRTWHCAAVALCVGGVVLHMVRSVKNTSVYVSGLPADVSDQELATTFGRIGALRKLKIYRHPDGQPKGDALVTYDLKAGDAAIGAERLVTHATRTSHTPKHTLSFPLSSSPPSPRPPPRPWNGTLPTPSASPSTPSPTPSTPPSPFLLSRLPCTPVHPSLREGLPRPRLHGWQNPDRRRCHSHGPGLSTLHWLPRSSTGRTCGPAGG